MAKNKITILAFAVLFLVLGNLQAQEWTRKLNGFNNPSLTWTSSMFNGQDVQQTNDGGYVLAGIQSYATGAPRDYPNLVKVNAQGFTLWHKSYFSDSANIAFFTKLSLVEMPNGNLLLAGLNSNEINLIQTDSQGDTIWTKTYPCHCTQLGAPCSAFIIKIRATNDGNYILAISMNLQLGAPLSPAYTQLIKIDPSGTVLWQKIYNLVYTEDVRPTADGGYILAGSATPAAYIPMLYKVDMNGDSVWQQTYSGQLTSGLHNVVQAPDGGYVVVTEWNTFPVGSNPLISKTDAQGNLLTWGAQFGVSPGGQIYAGTANSVDYDPNGYFVVAGTIQIPHPSSAMIDVAFFAKVDLAGNVLAEQNFDVWNANQGIVAHPTTDNGYILAGSNSTSLGSLDLGYLVKVDSMLTRPTHKLQGYVYRDNNNDCTKDTTENGLNGWIIEIKKGVGTYYTTTDSTGFYTATLDTGAFTIKAILNNGLWNFCVDSFNVVSANLINSDTFHFGASALINCPLLEVDISSAILRRCSTSVYTVNYCNEGTIDAQNAYIELELDTSLTVVGASIPYTGGGGFYTFNVGTVAFGDCASFTVTTLVSCYVPVGATHCVSAHIFPDTNCAAASPLWDQSDIDVDGVCYGDSIIYKIKNIGLGNMSVPRQYFVTEDHVMLFSNPFQLNAGDSITETVYTHNGSVYRLQAAQDPNHPYSTYTALGVQMCMGFAVVANGLMGVLGQFAEDDGSPAVSIDCRQNVASFDPNDKQVFPTGYGVNHYIDQDIDLDYHIRFQNTGNDTAFNIIVFDTLSSFLNPATVQPGASSHPYTWELKNSNVLVFYFNNVLLPDSNVNEAASHGFIKFRIKQDVQNPLGTIIYNSAGIVFDMNAPVITNTTFSTVNKDFIVDVEKIGDRPATRINVYPNPIQEQAVIKVEGEVFETLELRVVDAMGREVQYQQVNFEQQIMLYRQNLLSGVYFFQLIGDGEVIGVGKVIFN